MNGLVNNPLRKILTIVGVVACLIFACVAVFSLWEDVDPQEIVVIQDPVDGELHWHTTQGVKWQNWGKITRYPKRDIYEFNGYIMQIEDNKNEGQFISEDGAGTRFNDGAEVTIQGSLQFDYPTDEKSLNMIHSKYGSSEKVKTQLIEVVTDKAIFMTGPLLSSKESYSEKRTDLINWAEDQVNGGIYKTRQVQVDEIDKMTGGKRTVTRSEILVDSNGVRLRQEKPQLTLFGLIPRNFSVTNIVYPKKVRDQITSQQENIMAVETAISKSKQAEQQAITTEKEGQADAAKAKWVQETIKAQKVTEAEQNLAVADLEMKAAEKTKMKEILLGQGEAERKRLVLNADGALVQKLEAYVAVNSEWAKAYAQRSVPYFMMGGSGGNSGPGMLDRQTSDFQQSMNLLIAGQLGLDFSIPKGKSR